MHVIIYFYFLFCVAQKSPEFFYICEKNRVKHICVVQKLFDFFHVCKKNHAKHMHLKNVSYFTIAGLFTCNVPPIFYFCSKVCMQLRVDSSRFGPQGRATFRALVSWLETGMLDANLESLAVSAGASASHLTFSYRVPHSLWAVIFKSLLVSLIKRFNCL